MLTDANLIYARLCGIKVNTAGGVTLIARHTFIDQTHQAYIEYLDTIVDGVWPEPEDPELQDMIRRANIRKSILHAFNK
jgi:hypothetical protein